MTVEMAGYLSGVQMTVPWVVPALLVLVTATRGSGAPLMVSPRKLGSTVEKLLLLIDTNDQFSRRTLTASVDMFRTKLAGIFAASVAAAAAWPRSRRVRARPSVAKLSVV